MIKILLLAFILGLIWYFLDIHMVVTIGKKWGWEISLSIPSKGDNDD